ncbi:MAG: F0F1 ATP synthase subunit A [Candidatus Riflebacteria bacterium]|nr:F0F1 ATP synthase subunit A [Candidatus Riflebacteria bacterium]
MEELEAKFFYFFSFIHVSPGIVVPWFLTGVFVAIVWLGTRNLSLVPSPLQNVLEWVYESLATFIGGIIGEKHADEFTPFFTTIFLYILCANLAGVIPGLKSPTSLFPNCLTLALIIFFLTHYIGFKHHGIGYLKHFWGEPFWMGPLMLPIHIIGELARPMSLTFRLFGNIFGEDVVVIVLSVAIFPLLVPVPMLCLQIFTGLIQALVFTTLSCIYIKGAVGSDEH